ncbi:ead/Ea22-like family protein [Salmonella enterica]|uniref:Ead/Ea22-like family protein n=1 Tax=Salmonella enterica TaxID=28901 RepID=A0A5Y8Q498_SALER|nr:ead/Ea22-like family protein [Salmonella enterica]EGO1199860.1 ead/Ea22-like family protein [Salmonella enterica]EHV1520328.1 ead/Ea22-like family protein [Salmonella enterica]EHX2742139.1 ead/Ea22-like family protein [Salmonella enterica]EJT3840014.1 ead/Ea22-like family protein [Salmonella enterica]
MTIDKQALREAAEKATRGPWEMERENIWFTDEDGYTKHLAYVQQGDDVDDKQDHYNTAFIAAANPATMLALLDENLQLQREKDATEAVALALRDDMRQAREQLEAAEKRIADGSKRIAELEKGHQEAAKQINSWRRLAKQNIAERGKDISELEAARQRIAELEARAVNLPKRSVDEVMHLSGFSRDYAEGWCAGNDNAMHEIRAAGIKVKGE